MKYLSGTKMSKDYGIEIKNPEKVTFWENFPCMTPRTRNNE